MTRWNIVNIFFLGVSGQRRDVTFEPGQVNIITGASGKGKSALIKAVDYCLGSSKCELPVHIRRRSVAVGVKWVSGEAEMIIGRVIPPVGQASSTHMYATTGRNLQLPESINEFDGATTLDAAKGFIERAFGIGDISERMEANIGDRGRATIRHVTPYLFVTKEVIDSETVLLHGLEQADKARHMVLSMPYFLRATDEAGAINEARLRRLQKALDQEEARQQSRDAAASAIKQRATSLLTEAYRIGITSEPSVEASEAELLAQLQGIASTDIEADTYPDEGELGLLHSKRQKILSELESVRRQSRATRTALRDAIGFQGAVARQREKLILAEHLGLNKIAEICPVCEAPSERGRVTAEALKATLVKVREESAAVERVQPRLAEHNRDLDEQSRILNDDLRRVDDQIRTWLRQTEETRRLADIAQLRAHLLGRISFFLESIIDEPRQVKKDLNVLRTEIAELEARYDQEAKRTKLQRAERKVSQFASEAFAQLPTVEPCVGADLEFSSRQPDIAVIEAKTGTVMRMPDVGSDQNYLAVHISLSFALQRYFEAVNAPVPGILVLDQISRPYFPARGEDQDEAEIKGGEESEDEDIQAMRKHIDFLFAETAARNGLQVLLIEHAFFADDPRYVAATRERWSRASGLALIPLDWPTRNDE